MSGRGVRRGRGSGSSGDRNVRLRCDETVKEEEDPEKGKEEKGEAAPAKEKPHGTSAESQIAGKQLEGGKKKQEDEAAISDTSSSSVGIEGTPDGDTAGSAGSRRVRNKSKAEKRAAAALKKQNEEAAAAAALQQQQEKKQIEEAAAAAALLQQQQILETKQQDMERLEKKQSEEVDSLKKKQATEAEIMRSKHEAQLGALVKRQWKEVEALKKMQEAEAVAKQLHPVDPPSPVAPDSLSPANTPPSYGRKGTGELHSDYLSEYVTSQSKSGKGSKKSAEKLRRQEELMKKLEDEKLQKKLHDEEMKKQLHEEVLKKELEDKELKMQLEEEANKLRDKSLVQSGLTFVNVLLNSALEDEQRKKDEAENAQRQLDLVRENKLKAAEEMKEEFANFLNK